ncbi:hypothetical protein [Lacticaseibacillus kribbianus]|uniref:hypothetical protein n=1 Tax=Lacticaseibacillus kribbianus TaxID=2926292 RepID=UPI001CD6B67E|nr:hypothetical protein [Lacticaseibacillus kribbianus]
MIDYYLINQQDYFAAGYTISRGQAYVDTTGGLETAASASRRMAPQRPRRRFTHKCFRPPLRKASARR